MKLRTGILLACLLVVPLLAMFSHKIPRSLRDQWRRHVWQPLAGLATQPAPAPMAAVPTGPAASPEPAEPAEPATATKTVEIDTATAAAPDAVETLPEVALRSTLLANASEATVDAGADATIESMTRRLSSLGAVGLQVKRAEPVPYATGVKPTGPKPTGPKPPGPTATGSRATGIVHVASCRLPVDATGQLQRFFQATGPTAEESVSRLTEQVAAWKSRIAAQPAPAAPPASGRFQ
jgi:hypothetical protein